MAEAVGVGEDGEVVGVELLAAEGAAGVALEPAVDAVDVEGVLALGEEAEDFGVLEFGEANGAFEALAGAFERGEAEERKGFYDGLVDTGEAGAGPGEAVVVEEVWVVVEDIGVGGVAEFGVHEEEEGEGEQDGEDSDYDGDARLEGVGHVLRAVRQLVRLSSDMVEEDDEEKEEEMEKRDVHNLCYTLRFLFYYNSHWHERVLNGPLSGDGFRFIEGGGGSHRHGLGGMSGCLEVGRGPHSNRSSFSWVFFCVCVCV